MAIQYIDQNCDAVGTLAGPFAITAGSNDTLTLTIDGGAAQTFTLTPGTARSAAQVAADINATLTGATAYGVVAGGFSARLRIRTTSSAAASSTIVIGSPTHNAAATLGLSGTYTGSSRIHTSWAAVLGTKQEMINQVETQLLTCGWTTISGSGTTNLLMQSGISPPGQDLVYRIRLKDTGATSVGWSVENVSGSAVTANNPTAGQGCLQHNTAGRTWWFTAHKYGAFIRSTLPGTMYEFIAFGSVSLPTFLQGVITEAAWMQCNVSGNDTAGQWGFSFWSHQSCEDAPNQNMIVNGNPYSANGFGNNWISAQAYSSAVGFADQNSTWGLSRWHDNSLFICDAIIGWGMYNNDECRARGYIWDACTVSYNGYNTNTAISFDSHNWVCLTHGPNMSMQGGGYTQLFLVTP